jgi:hypothetical protein
LLGALTGGAAGGGTELLGGVTGGAAGGGGIGVTGCMFNCVGSAVGAGAVVPPPELAAGSA